MPTLTKNPASVNVSNAWAFSTTSLTSDAADASDASYVVDLTLAQDLYYNYEDITEYPGGSLLNSVIVNSRLQNPSAGADGAMAIKVIWSGVGTLTSATQTPGAGFTNFAYDITSLIPAGQVVTTFNAVVAGANEVNYAVNPLRLVKQSIAVGVVPPAGGLIFLLLSLGPLVAVGLEHMPRMARAVLQRTRQLITPDEYRRALRELQEHRYPRHFVMG